MLYISSCYGPHDFHCCLWPSGLYQRPVGRGVEVCYIGGIASVGLIRFPASAHLELGNLTSLRSACHSGHAVPTMFEFSAVISIRRTKKKWLCLGPSSKLWVGGCQESLTFY